jgi:hypothetical protein
MTAATQVFNQICSEGEPSLDAYEGLWSLFALYLPEGEKSGELIAL